MNYTLGKKQATTEGTVFWVIQSIVKKSPGYVISHELLNAEMQKNPNWSEEVMRKPSKKVPGSHKWCHGWIVGAVRESYLRLDEAQT